MRLVVGSLVDAATSGRLGRRSFPRQELCCRAAGGSRLEERMDEEKARRMTNTTIDRILKWLADFFQAWADAGEEAARWFDE